MDAHECAMRHTVRIKSCPEGYKAYRYPVFVVRWSEAGTDGRPKRREHVAKSKREAEDFQRRTLDGIRQRGAEHASVSKEEQAALIRFREWRKATEGAPTLPAIIEAAISAHGTAGKSLTFSEAMNIRLESISRQGLTKLHFDGTKGRLKRFAEDFGDRQISGFSRDEIEGWLYRLNLSPVSWRNYAIAISSVFAMAVERQSINRNPMDGMKAPKVIATEPGILTPQQARALLASADPTIIPLLVLQGWCGVRLSEAQRLHWRDIHLDHQSPQISLFRSVTKRDRSRTPSIPPNAAKWLRAFRGLPDAPVGVPVEQYKKKLRAARKKAGIKWGKTILRHSCATYLIVNLGNAAKAALDLGHSETILNKNYRTVTYPKAAREWFSITPERRQPSELLPRKSI
jgi:integrase